jgi:thiamine biosynthesis lipoprotein
VAWNRPLIILLLLGLVALGWWRMQPAAGEQLRRSRLLMGTMVEIVVYGDDAGRLEQAVDAAFAEMTRLERLLSRHFADSDVSRLSAATRGAEVTAETAAVIELGLEVAQRSQGAFDLTLGQLKRLWGFDAEKTEIPARAAVAAALDGIGPRALQLDGLRVTKRSPGLALDLGGIAKGYAVDRAIAVLKEHGVSSAAVNAGGDMYLLGTPPQRLWRIGIQHPRRRGAVLETIGLRDAAVVTSGDYERFFERDGVRYHHIFDPASGFPARGCQSVTIVADSVALADALATAVFVLGPQQGLRLLESYAGSEGLIIDSEGRRHASGGWGKLLQAER